jgi:uncharacterized membrane protein SpoIIM required for sporulation
LTRIIIVAVILAGAAAVEIMLARRARARETPTERVRRYNAEGWPEEGI